MPSQSTTNSSPPIRATVSAGRTAAPQPGGDRLQHLVADVMTEGIVDFLEAVDVAEKRGDAWQASPRTAERLLDAVDQQVAVRQSGERSRATPSAPALPPHAAAR